jgi:hypothetical protein
MPIIFTLPRRQPFFSLICSFTPRLISSRQIDATPLPSPDYDDTPIRIIFALLLNIFFSITLSAFAAA